MSKRKAEQDYVIEGSDVTEIKNSQGFVSSPDKDIKFNIGFNINFPPRSVGLFLQTFAVMPASVTCLQLGWNNLGEKNVKELVEIFAAIPIRVTSLKLDANDLTRLSAKELATVLLSLPPSVTSLNLEENELYIFTGEELAIVFAALPSTVTALNLSLNRLGQKIQEKVLQCMTRGTSEDWRAARSLPFSNIGPKLALAFAALPPTITSLDLSSNSFEQADADELAQAFAALPPTVTALYFNSDDFHNKTEEQLVFIFGALHNSLTSLGLTRGELKQNTESMAFILSTMASKRSNLNFLDLKDNDLGEKAVAELCKLFKTIPKSVTEIDLNGNSFGRKTAEELAEVFGSMPDSVTSLDLSADNLTAFFALENEALLCPVFRHITTLCLGDKFMASLPPQVRLRLPNVFPRLAKLIPVDQWGNKIKVGPYCDANFIRSFGVIPYAPSVQSSLSMFAPTNTIPMEEVPEPENTGISCLVS